MTTWCSVSRGAAHEARRIANAAVRACRAMMSILPVSFLPTLKSEEFFRSCGGCASDFFQRNAARASDLFRNEPGISRFATFSTEGHRCEIRAIRFNHESIERNFGSDIAHLF